MLGNQLGNQWAKATTVCKEGEVIYVTFPDTECSVSFLAVSCEPACSGCGAGVCGDS